MSREAQEDEQLSTGPRLLLVDSDDNDRALATAVLGSELPDARLEEAATAADYAAALARGDFDVVICEQQLEWTEGLSLVPGIREKAPQANILFFTRVDTAAMAMEAMRAGASDYLVKSSSGFVALPGAVSRLWELARVEDERRLYESRVQTLLDRSRIGMFRASLDQRLLEASPALLRLLGVDTLQAAQRIGPSELYYSSEQRAELLDRLDDEGKLPEREVELRLADGGRIRVHLTEFLLVDEEGDLVVDGLARDVSGRWRRTEELKTRLRELEGANADLRDFASVVAHELQEPLRMMERYTQMLQEEYRGRLDPDADEYIGFAADGARTMQRIIDDLLVLSRVSGEPHTFHACECDSLLDRAIRALWKPIEETGARIHRLPLPTVVGDATQLMQLFQNLLSNALRFRSTDPPDVRVTVEETGEDWIFSISDNGLGIPETERERVFEIFKRLHPEEEGSGVGLTICRRIVERHGGRIWVEAGPDGGGTVMRFTLPRRGGVEPAVMGGSPASVGQRHD